MSVRIPSYRLHKGSGQALVQIDGQRIYLGVHGTPDSKEKYDRLIAEWLAARRDNHPPASPNGVNPFGLTVNEVLLLYWRFAKGYYVKDGQPTKELFCMREAIRPVRELYGTTLARDFGPLALKAVQHHMVDADISRGVVNHRVNRIRRVFKWAVSEELLPAGVHEALRTVTGLRFGRTDARETEPVKPVPDEWVVALLPFLSPHVAAMIQVQRFSGMRPCEVVIMRPCDIDTTDDVWIYEPFDHKNRWRGHRKLLPLGPKAQQVLEQFLDRDDETFLFSPREAEAWRVEHRPVHYKTKRKTPIYPSELRSRARAKQARKKRKSKRPKRDHYDTDSYRRAINYGFVKAAKAGVEISHWHPNQLRHSRATEIRSVYGVEGAQVSLGHKRADITEIYAEKNLELAKSIARETG